MSIKFDDNQFEKRISKFRVENPKVSRFDSEKIMKTIQLLAIIISGCWVLYTYWTYQKKADENNLKLGELNKENTILEISKNRQDSIMKMIDLGYYERLSELNLKRLKQDSGLKSIELNYANELNQLNTQNKKFDNDLKGLQVAFAKDVKIEYTDSLHIIKIGKIKNDLNEYKVEVYLKITNQSQNQLEISYTVLEGFIQDIEVDTLNLNSRAVLFGAPPDFFHQTFFKDGFCYPFESTFFKKITTEGHIYSKEEKEILKNKYAFGYYICNRSFDGGLLTGIYKPGEYGYFSMKCTVIAKKNTMLTFCTSLILNKGVKDEYLRSYSDAKDLREIN